jgi:hypothetical protein
LLSVAPSAAARVLGAPGERDQPGVGRRVGVKREHRFHGGHAGESDRALPQAGALFEPVEARADGFEIGRPVGLGDQKPADDDFERHSASHPVQPA